VGFEDLTSLQFWYRRPTGNVLHEDQCQLLAESSEGRSQTTERLPCFYAEEGSKSRERQLAISKGHEPLSEEKKGQFCFFNKQFSYIADVNQARGTLQNNQSLITLYERSR